LTPGQNQRFGQPGGLHGQVLYVTGDIKTSG
jgi:hypothetical protein